MRQLYPALWVATLGLAALILLRPGGLGTLLALAATWENAPWPNPSVPQGPQPAIMPPMMTGAAGPRTSSRPAAWPGYGPPEGVPEAATRPASWEEPAPANRCPSPDTIMPPQANAVPCEGAEILGRVGSEVILAKEVSTGIAELRARNPNVPKDILDAQIRKMLQKRLRQKIEQELVYLDAQRTVPAENFPKIKDGIAREFEESQVPEMMKRSNARTRQELENALEAAGTSLEMQKQDYIEGTIARGWLREQTKVDEDVSHQQALAYYHDHVADFEKPARARWEQLMVKTARFRSRQEAYAALAEMGNEVLNGRPLAEVAKAQSHGPSADEGGQWGWTTQGSLTSQLLDEAIFGKDGRPGIPVGALSPILEEENAMHIIRVLERQPVHRIPFDEAQVEINKKIRTEREAQAKEDYMAKLRRMTPVWTAFDAPATASAPGGWIR